MADIVQRKPEASSLQALKHVLDRVPPEAITKAVDIIADVVRANKVIEAREQEFEHELSMLREINLDRKDRLRMLIDLMARISLTDDAQSRIVDSVCKIAEGTP